MENDGHVQARCAFGRPHGAARTPVYALNAGNDQAGKVFQKDTLNVGAPGNYDSLPLPVTI